MLRSSFLVLSLLAASLVHANEIEMYETLLTADGIGTDVDSMVTSLFPVIEMYSWGGVDVNGSVVQDSVTGKYVYQLVIQVPSHCTLGGNCGAALGAFVPTKDVVSCTAVTHVTSDGAWTFEATELDTTYSYINHTVTMSRGISATPQYGWARFSPTQQNREEVGFLVSAQHPTDGSSTLTYSIPGTLVQCERSIGAHLQ